MTDVDREYLRRVFAREAETALAEALRGQTEVSRRGAAAGNFRSSTTLVMVREKHEQAFRAALFRMIQFAYDATGSTSQDIVDEVAAGAHGVRDLLSGELQRFLDGSGSFVAPAPRSEIVGKFVQSCDKALVEALDDMKHRILGGRKLSQETTATIIDSIVNSPGAAQQRGSGNVQTVISGVVDPIAMRSAIAEFLASKEVLELTPEAREAITDTADVIKDELSKPAPDESKMRRWGKRLLSIAEQFGISMAASAVASALGL